MTSLQCWCQLVTCKAAIYPEHINFGGLLTVSSVPAAFQPIFVRRRYTGDARTRARSALLRHTTPTAVVAAKGSISTGVSSAGGAVPFSIRVDSPYLQPLRDQVLIASGEEAGGGSGGSSVHNASQSAASESGSINGGNGGGGIGTSPSKAKKATPQSAAATATAAANAVDSNPAAGALKAVELCAPGSGGGGAMMTNVAMLNFAPTAAGTYPATAIVAAAWPSGAADVRCYEMTAVLSPPDVVTELMFRCVRGWGLGFSALNCSVSGVCHLLFASKF